MITNRLERPRNLFGKRMKSIRKSLGYSFSNISTDTAISKPYLSKIERGIKSPSGKTMDVII